MDIVCSDVRFVRQLSSIPLADLEVFKVPKLPTVRNYLHLPFFM